ncbi:MAG: hypothetical protein M0005_07250 [Actinomycetota bacterium]|nr:hypothetical protein [Actinomycetota bacterium]
MQHSARGGRWEAFGLEGAERPPLAGAGEVLADWARSEAEVEARSAGLVPFPPRLAA